MFKTFPKSPVAKQLARIKAIGSGPGSAYVPNVTTVDLVFKVKNSGGHMGARKFWRQNLPRLKFYNPEVLFNVQRVEGDEDCPARLTVHFADGKKRVIDCKHKHSSDILEDFLKLTQAKEVPPEEMPAFKSKFEVPF